MENRINSLFKSKREILSIFFTAGFPQLQDTISIAKSLQNSDVDVIEIGIPFSDPVADGPTIQMSNKAALENGMNVKLLIEQVSEIRKSVSIPIILMGYLNPVIQYGIEKFFKDAAKAGVDGLILPDLPLDEYERYKLLLKENNLAFTFLVSPQTSNERILKIDALTDGFLYAVSSSSTTGAKGDFTKEQDEYFQRLSNLKLRNPFLVGFGISNNSTFKHASKYASGAIIGSAFIQAIQNSVSLEEDIKTFVNKIRGKES